jgi:hypothetical protein
VFEKQVVHLIEVCLQRVLLRTLLFEFSLKLGTLVFDPALAFV